MIVPVFKSAFSDLISLGSISRAIGDMLGQLYDIKALRNTKSQETLLRRLDKRDNKDLPDRL